MSLESVYWLIVLGIGVVAHLIGFTAILFPTKMSAEFGIAVSGSAKGFVVGLGIRDIFIGICFVAIYLASAASLVPALSLALGLVAFSDFFVVFKYGNRKKALVHLAGGVFSLLFALFGSVAI